MRPRHLLLIKVGSEPGFGGGLRDVASSTVAASGYRRLERRPGDDRDVQSDVQFVQDQGGTP